MKQHTFVPLIFSGIFHAAVILGLTFLFCWGLGIYTLGKATDALFVFSLCYTLIALEGWVGRALRFYFNSNLFRSPLHVTEHDRPDLPPRQRGWLLVVSENRIFMPWAVAGFAIFAAALLITLTIPLFSTRDTVLPFLVRQDLPYLMRPGVWPR